MEKSENRIVMNYLHKIGTAPYGICEDIKTTEYCTVKKWKWRGPVVALKMSHLKLKL